MLKPDPETAEPQVAWGREEKVKSFEKTITGPQKWAGEAGCRRVVVRVQAVDTLPESGLGL